MFTLTATDHREGAYGDVATVTLDTLDACHDLARTLNCGIYTTNDGTTITTWESDGTTATAIDTEAITVVDNARKGCPATTNGHHAIEWMDVPAMVWVGGSDHGGIDTPAMRRGFCWHCDERFTDGN